MENDQKIEFGNTNKTNTTAMTDHNNNNNKEYNTNKYKVETILKDLKDIIDTISQKEYIDSGYQISELYSSYSDIRQRIINSRYYTHNQP